jgi:hypothetical protein
VEGLLCISELVNKVGVDDGLSGGFGSTGSPCNGADILKFASLDGLVLEAVLEEHAGCIVVACKSGWCFPLIVHAS